MRVIAGSAKGRRLVVPAGESVRPTADRVREALFSSLQPILRGARVLDLFAGSGALGIEALSRGAEHATFVEPDRKALEAIKTNLETATLTDRADVIAGRAVAHLRTLDPGNGTPGRIDLAFLDPPYALGDEELADVLTALQPALAPDATVIVERDSRSDPPRWPAGMEPAEPRAYGSTTLHRAVHHPNGHAADPPDEIGMTDHG